SRHCSFVQPRITAMGRYVATRGGSGETPRLAGGDGGWHRAHGGDGLPRLRLSPTVLEVSRLAARALLGGCHRGGGAVWPPSPASTHHPGQHERARLGGAHSRPRGRGTPRSDAVSAYAQPLDPDRPPWNRQCTHAPCRFAHAVGARPFA